MKRSISCPNCGAAEIEASTPWTVYACGSKDYDQRPGTFERKCGCSVCGSGTAELRPYGTNGAPICFTCMKAAPEREIEARTHFGAVLAKHDRLGVDTQVQQSSAPLPRIRR